MSQLKIDSASAEEDMVIDGPSHNGKVGNAIDLLGKLEEQGVRARYLESGATSRGL